jgi:hypothetical protein
MKTYLVKFYDEGRPMRSRIEADGYIVGSDGSLHMIKEQHLGRPPVPFVAFSNGTWEMVAEVPADLVEKGLDKEGTIDVAPIEESN